MGITHLVCARLTFAVSFGSFQAATVLSPIPGRRERKRETARNNEAWDQLEQREFGFFPRRRDCVSLTQVTRGRWTGWSGKKKVKDGNNKSCSVPEAILLASPSVYANAKRFIDTFTVSKVL